LNINPKNAYIWVSKGISLGELGHYADAAGAFDSAIDVDPNYSKAWYNRGVAYENLNEYDRAIQSFDRSILLDPDYSIAWYVRARCKNKKGNVEDCLADLKKAIEIGKETCVELARIDQHFNNIRGDRRFKIIVSGSVGQSP
jgi:tetratricopeptide (TPR) repeat protein